MRDPKVSHSPRLIRKPDVSIILPTYCRGENGLLKRAMDSVLSQAFTSFELLVMDDGSMDCTAELVTEYVKSDDRVIHVRHDDNCGLPALRVNEGLLTARADLCAYQFDDDQWTSATLATLTRELRRNPEYEVAYGLCKLSIDGDERMLGGPFDYSRLMTANYIANNSLMHRRSIFERLGGYDMHLVMRRLCDWDLWLRWSRRSPFLFVDEWVSTVEARLPRSIGATCVADLFVTRSQMALNRDGLLRPDALRSYAVDDLDRLKHLGKRKVESVWRQQIAPYLSRFRDRYAAVRPPQEKPVHVLVSKGKYASTFDTTVGNFTEALASSFVFTLVPESQTDEASIRCADILLLHRTTDSRAVELAEIATRHGKAVVFLMDDDLLTLHEVAEDFAWLAPGTSRRAALETVIRRADLVITYSPLTQESVQQLNPRNAVLEITIRQKWLAAAKSGLAQQSEEVGRPVRIGFAGGAARREEFAVLWPALVEASRDLGAGAEFHFWGFTPDGLEELHSPWHCEPFASGYEQYLDRLTSRGFDVMIAPLFAETRAKRAKTPIKFLEISAAGAVGVYSDVEPYRAVIDGANGIKCENTVQAWREAILEAASLCPGERRNLVANAIKRVERDHTSEVHAPRLAATLEAGVLHARLNRNRSGRPRIGYFCHTPYLSGAGSRLLGYASRAQHFQFDPVLILPSGLGATAEVMQQNANALGIEIAYLPLRVETEMDVSRKLDESAVEEIRNWLAQNGIALVHSFLLMREVGEAARRLRVPHVASLFETYSRDPADVRHCDAVHSDALFYAECWSEVLNAPARRIMSYVTQQYFELGDSLDAIDPVPGGRLTVGLFGNMRPGKGQLEAVEAVGLLKQRFDERVQLRLFGYDHFDPSYVAACKEKAEQYGVSQLISFRGFAADRAAEMRELDAVLCASNWESLPEVILEAMAAGRLVMAPDLGGIGEMVSHRTGVLMPDNSVDSICQAFRGALHLTGSQWRARTRVAREAARQECSEYPVATELFRLYRQAAAHWRTAADSA